MKITKVAALLAGAALALSFVACNNNAEPETTYNELLVGQKRKIAESDDATPIPVAFLFGEDTVNLTADGDTENYFSEYNYSLTDVDEQKTKGTLALNLSRVAAPRDYFAAADAIANGLQSGTYAYGKNIVLPGLKDAKGNALPAKRYTKKEYTTFLKNTVKELEDYKTGANTIGMFDLTTDKGRQDFQNQIDAFKKTNAADVIFKSPELSYDATLDANGDLTGMQYKAGTWTKVRLENGRFQEGTSAASKWDSATVELTEMSPASSSSSEEEDTQKAADITATVAVALPSAGVTDNTISTTAGDTVILVATAETGTEGEVGDITYQWYLNGTAIADATNEVYAFTASTETKGAYYVIATNTVSSTLKSASSVDSAQIYAVKVNAPATGTAEVDVSPAVQKKAEAEAPVLLTADFKADDGSEVGVLTYEWSKMASGETSFTGLDESEKQIMVNAPAAGGKDIYKCVVTNTVDSVEEKAVYLFVLTAE